VSGLASHQSSRGLGGQQGGSLSRGGGSISAGHQSRRPETEEERRERKKREYERSKAEQKSTSQPGATSSRVAPVNGSRDPRTEKRSVTASDKIENRLKRPSTFLCKIRFRNELPDPVSQPKLMHINDKDQYTKYKVTSLENNYKHKLYVEPDLGISLDLLDLSAYKLGPRWTQKMQNCCWMMML
jgi:RNA polymerase II-associated factor 1